MTSRFAKAGSRWLKAAATTAAGSALVLGGLGAAPSAASQSHDDHEGHDGHSGGDACEFFLEHMWANEDGIPLLGSFSHINEYHTDPVYENLVLSLASGAIGNSDMPIIDIYGGPLGWIPVFNPSHVKGHDTDYVTLLTSCGGIGLPLDSNDLTALDVPSVEELTDLSELIIPGLPSPEMLTDPEYLWETTDASAILERITPETLLNLEEYIGFAGDHFDTWRLLWETALDSVASGNPTEILELLEITENVNTLQSLSEVVGDNALGELLGEEQLGSLLEEGGMENVTQLQGLLDEGGLDGLLQGGELDGLLELEGILDDGGLESVLGEGGLDDLLNQDGLDGLLELEGLLDEGGLEGVLGEDGLDSLLGEQGLLGGLGLNGLLGGGDSGDENGEQTVTQYSVLFSSSEGSSGMGQCDATLEGNSLTVNCLYAGLSSEVTDVTLNLGGEELELTHTGETAGAASGSFELTEEQIETLQSGEVTITITTTGSTEGELSGGVTESCDCEEGVEPR